MKKIAVALYEPDKQITPVTLKGSAEAADKLRLKLEVAGEPAPAPDRQTQKIEAAAEAGVVAQVQEIATRQRTISPQIGEIVQDVVEAFGGTKKFARAVHDEFNHAKPGSMNRAKILDMVTRLMQADNKMSGITQQTDDLSDEDLARITKELIGA